MRSRASERKIIFDYEEGRPKRFFIFALLVQIKNIFHSFFFFFLHIKPHFLFFLLRSNSTIERRKTNQEVSFLRLSADLSSAYHDQTLRNRLKVGRIMGILLFENDGRRQQKQKRNKAKKRKEFLPRLPFFFVFFLFSIFDHHSSTLVAASSFCSCYNFKQCVCFQTTTKFFLWL